MGAVLLVLGLGCRDEAPAAPTADQRSRERAEAMQEAARACEPQPGEVAADDACARGCALGHSNSCARLAQQLERAGDRAAALARFREACRGGSGVGCQGAGRLGDGEPAYRKARGYHRVHCEQGYAASCAALAELFARGVAGPTDEGAATTYRERACSLGLAGACR